MLSLTLALCASQLVRTDGFQSAAGLFYGSGAPDFTCGNSDNLADGGWGGQSKYCKIKITESDSYNQGHADLTVSVGYRSAGLLFSLENSYWSSAFNVFKVDYEGSPWSWGSYYASKNGGGIRNAGSYLGLMGVSSNPQNTPDILATTWGATHHNKGYVFGVQKDPNIFAFMVRDDGAIALSGQIFTVATNDDALYLAQELPDGGERVAVIKWAQ